MVQAYSKNELVEKASEWVVREEDVRVLGWGYFQETLHSVKHGTVSS